MKQVVLQRLEPGTPDRPTSLPALPLILPTPGIFPHQQPPCTLHTSPFPKSPAETSLLPHCMAARGIKNATCGLGNTAKPAWHWDQGHFKVK